MRSTVNHFIHGCIGALLVLLGTEPCFAQAYRVVDLAELQGSGLAQLVDINDTGMAVGNLFTNRLEDYEPAGAILVHYDRDPVLVGRIPNALSVAAVNDFGSIVGTNTGGRAAIWRAGVATEIGEGTPVGINNQELVLVASTTGAYVWREGYRIDLGRPPGSDGFFAHSLNERGEVAGAVQFGTEFVLGVFSLNTRTFDVLRDVQGVSPVINERGALLFLSYNVSPLSYGARLHYEGSTTALLSNFVPHDLNDQNVGVGLYFEIGETSTAVVWNGETLTHLPTAVDTQTEARAINNAGVIVGSVRSWGYEHAVLWIPETQGESRWFSGELAPGDECARGGVELRFGYDDDADGRLSPEETEDRVVVCHGDDGADGMDGVDGVDGRDGLDGVNGIDGRDGLDGMDGANGIDGRDGLDGANGIDGRDGLDGMDGANGIDGRDGLDGANGIDGRDGLDGMDGRDGIDATYFADDGGVERMAPDFADGSLTGGAGGGCSTGGSALPLHCVWVFVLVVLSRRCWLAPK